MTLFRLVLLGALLLLALTAQQQGLDTAIKQYDSCHCAEAVAKIEAAAQQGSPLAMLDMGIISEDGVAVRKSYLQAISWYRRAAATGFHSAYLRLGSLLHRLGQDEEATTLLQRETSGPSAADAFFELGQIADAPATDGQPDLAKARMLYQQASQAGNVPAKRELGWMIAKGVGGPVNPDEGHELLMNAAKNGDNEALLRMGDIERENPKRMTAGVMAPLYYYELAGKNGDSDGYFRAVSMFEFGRIRGLGGAGYSPNYQRIWAGWRRQPNREAVKRLESLVARKRRRKLSA